MKKEILLLIAAALVILLVVHIVSCSDGDEDDNGDPETSDDDSTSDDDDDNDDDNDDNDDNNDDSGPECWTDIPVGQKEIFADGFSGTEGIAFGPDGNLWVSSGDTVSRIQPDGLYDSFGNFDNAVGIAFTPEGSLYVCDFGASALPSANDGAIYELDDQMNQKLIATGIANPNFITYTPQGTFLISDNMADIIYELTEAGALTEWLTGIDSPNGIVYSRDRSSFYVAGTFVASSPLYEVSVADPASFTVIANLDTGGLPDGVALDENGMVYVVENLLGKLVRVDPLTGTFETIADQMFTPASAAFGQDPGFDPCSLYVTELSGTKVWRVSLGVHGYPLVNEE